MINFKKKPCPAKKKNSGPRGEKDVRRVRVENDLSHTFGILFVFVCFVVVLFLYFVGG